MKLKRTAAFSMMVLTSLTTAACTEKTETKSVTTRSGLPPSDQKSIEKMFAADLKKWDLRITRAALVDMDHGYERSAHGDRLAVYLEPTGPYSAKQYADAVVPTAQVFLPTIFDRWPELESFDLCLEPVPGTDDSKEPPAQTQLAVTREEAAKFDWSKVTLRELVLAHRADPPGLRMFIRPALANDPAFRTLTDPDWSTS